MAVSLDHTIIGVNDPQEAVSFYTGMLGLEKAPDQGPFTSVRVNDATVLLFAKPLFVPTHFAFAMEPHEFDAAFQRLRDAGVAYGDRYDRADNGAGPGEEEGARGKGRALYFNDPSGNLLEIRSYA